MSPQTLTDTKDDSHAQVVLDEMYWLAIQAIAAFEMMRDIKATPPALLPVAVARITGMTAPPAISLDQWYFDALSGISYERRGGLQHRAM